MSGAADGPDLVAAKRLMDAAKDQGFTFQRIAPGPDGPLRGVRETSEFLDEVYVAGFWEPDACTAIPAAPVVTGRAWRTLVTAHVTGDALTVLHTVVSEWSA